MIRQGAAEMDAARLSSDAAMRRARGDADDAVHYARQELDEHARHAAAQVDTYSHGVFLIMHHVPAIIKPHVTLVIISPCNGYNAGCRTY